MTTTSNDKTRDMVREGYAEVARSGSLSTVTGSQKGGCCGPTSSSSCCGDGWSAEDLATQIGYSADEIRALPEGANMGLSCGNPVAIAKLQPGQVVLDLGCGGGFDVFLAGPKVGASGRAIGVDMTPEMLSKARAGIGVYQKHSSLDNVEFRLGEIEHLPVADASVDVVISNCVINLSPDKPQVWREIARVLKPRGIVAASDMALLRPLPESVRTMVEALVGCVSGAVLVEDYQQMVAAAGLEQIMLTPKPEYVATLASFKDPLYDKIAQLLPRGESVADYVTSLDVQAVKPVRKSCC